MTFLEVLVIFLIAVFITGVFVFILKNNGPWSIVIFFLVVFLASWAARLWIVPVGPLVWGVAWIPILTVGIIFAFILASATSKPKNPRKEIIEKQVGVETDEDKTSIALGAFFWLLIIILAISVIIGYGIKYLP